MKVTYDKEADAIYIQLCPIAPGTARNRQVTEDMVVDYLPDGKLAGIEVLNASALLKEDPARVIAEVVPSFQAKST